MDSPSARHRAAAAATAAAAADVVAGRLRRVPKVSAVNRNRVRCGASRSPVSDPAALAAFDSRLALRYHVGN